MWCALGQAWQPPRRRLVPATALTRKVDAVLNAGIEALERAHRGGVNVVFGTDLLGGMHRLQNEEFRIRAEVQPALDIIQAATITAARLLDEQRRRGELSVGSIADLLVIDRDPLEDVTVLAEPNKYIHTVVQGGRVVVSRPGVGGSDC